MDTQFYLKSGLLLQIWTFSGPLSSKYSGIGPNSRKSDLSGGTAVWCRFPKVPQSDNKAISAQLHWRLAGWIWLSLAKIGVNPLITLHLDICDP